MDKGLISVPGRPDSRVAYDQLIALAAVASTAPPGAFVEVGVYRGGSAWHLNAVAARQGRELHLFDTFTGIPHKGDLDQHAIGDYGDVDKESLRRAFPRAVFHVGVFPQTLPDDLRGFAFVHVDCDQYAGHRACIDLLYPRLVPGGIMMFDDYPVLKGAKRAVDETFSPGRLANTGYRFHVVKP